MSWDEVFKYAFVGLTTFGGGMGISKLFFIRSTNRNIEATTGKTAVETAATFSESVLLMLDSAQKSAEAARQQAEKAYSEIAFLRAWIIEQGLIPPLPPRG